MKLSKNNSTNEDLFRNLFFNSPIGMFIIQDGMFQFVNPKFEELSGYRGKELVNVHYENLVFPEDREKSRINGIKTLKGERSLPYEFRAIRKDNEIRWVLATLTSVQYQGKRAALGTFMDITDKKMLEEQLHEGMEQLQTVIEAGQEGITFSDEQGHFYVYNSEMERLTGYTMDEANSSSDFMVYLYPDTEEYQKERERLKLVNERVVVRNIETVFTTKQGRCKYILLSTCLVPYKGKTMFLSVYHDVTEQKEAEMSLRQAEKKYRSIFENAVEGIFQTTPEGRFVSANPALARMIGYDTPKELMEGITDLSIQGYVNPEDRVTYKKIIEDEGVIQGFETQHYRKDGSIIWVSINARAVRDTTGKVLHYEGTIEDITDRKHGEEEMKAAAEKLRKNLVGTIHALSVTVETRDPYTAGHQKKVSNLARTIAQEMGLPNDTVDIIRMAGVIHDLGKIAVPAEILSKPTKLTDIEFSLIKVHPQSGYDILKDVDLPYPIAEMVYQHHERLDGSGYPRGLKDGQILLEACILAVADVVEAMASYRPYRPARGIDAALEEIEKNKGIFYDAKAVDACVRLFREKGFTFETTAS